MTQSIDEQLSALLDGELPKAEEELLLRRLERSTEHRATLVRYSLIGELVRGSTPTAFDRRVLDGVHAALASEPASGDATAAKASSGWAFSLAGAGLAAAAALVALLSLNEPTGVPRTVTPVPVAGVIDATPSLGLERDRIEVRSAAPVIAPRRLTTYLVSHGDYAGGLSRQVMNSHVVNSTPVYLTADFRGVSSSE